MRRQLLFIRTIGRIQVQILQLTECPHQLVPRFQLTLMVHWRGHTPARACTRAVFLCVAQTPPHQMTMPALWPRQPTLLAKHRASVIILSTMYHIRVQSRTQKHTHTRVRERPQGLGLQLMVMRCCCSVQPHIPHLICISGTTAAATHSNPSRMPHYIDKLTHFGVPASEGAARIARNYDICLMRRAFWSA